MRKMICILLAAVTGILCLSAASAETEAVSVKELPGITSPEWKQTYEAYGRTIDVDVDITIPEVETVPMLKVRLDSRIAEPLKSELEAEYKAADRKDKQHHYEIESDEYFACVDHKIPLLWGKTKKKDTWTTAQGQENTDLFGWDMDWAYTENNPMTLGEATDIIRNHIREIYPDVETRLDRVMICGKTYWKKSGKPIYNKGSYDLYLRQCFRGIPAMACISDTYTVRSLKDIPDWFPRSSGDALGGVYSEDSWLIHCLWYKETGVVKEDVSLLPFDAVKDRVQALITSGHVRWINSVDLGYVLFATRTAGECLLAPCWVVWCEYHPEGPASEKTFGINDDESFFWGNNAYYIPLVFDAQTGNMFDPESTPGERLLYPGDSEGEL